MARARLLVVAVGCGSDGGGDAYEAEGREESRAKLAPLVERIERSGEKPNTDDVMELNKAEAYLKANRDTLNLLEQAVDAYEKGDERGEQRRRRGRLQAVRPRVPAVAATRVAPA